VLLIIQGGSGDADTPDALASMLGSEFTVVSYDRRGISRSTLHDPRQAITVEQHTEDAHALLEELSPEPAFVFGSSLGGLIALDLAVRWPGRVQAVVAHEPPALDLLTSAEQESFAELRKTTAAIALSEGTRIASRKFLREMGVDSEDHEDDIEPPPSSRERSRNADFVLARESRATDRFRLDLGALRAMGSKIIPAFGSSSRACFPARCTFALSAALGRDTTELPGGHTGYVLRPRAFAEALGKVLRANAPYSRIRWTGAGHEAASAAQRVVPGSSTSRH
jgi:pimeloyl-ACP methyl ester carboxylesterase